MHRMQPLIAETVIEAQPLPNSGPAQSPQGAVSDTTMGTVVSTSQDDIPAVSALPAIPQIEDGKDPQIATSEIPASPASHIPTTGPVNDVAAFALEADLFRGTG